ncbi:MAG: ABC transporter permease [Candidatus Marinimicrobia bacterium]|nr:ABC transporter permease [Candidatus Neomarinimicrobiota bacterium]
MIIIKPKNRIAFFPINELYHYRDLLYFLTKKNFIVKYKQTLIGISWAIIQPLMQMVVFSILFGRFAKIPSDDVPYPIFVYSALIPWTFFANSISACNNSIINHAGLINKVYFPRLLIPLSAVGSQVIDFGLSFIVLIGIMLFYQFPITWGFLMIVPLTILTIFSAVGFGTFIAALSGIYRDFRHIIPFFLSIWMFLTPVIYPPSLLGTEFEFIIHLNPMSGIVIGFRSAILNQAFNWTALLLALIISSLFFIIGIFYFNKAEDRFADLV